MLGGANDYALRQCLVGIYTKQEISRVELRLNGKYNLGKKRVGMALTIIKR